MILDHIAYRAGLFIEMPWADVFVFQVDFKDRIVSVGSFGYVAVLIVVLGAAVLFGL